MGRALFGLALLVSLSFGCKDRPATQDGPDAPASPQAAVVPAPLSSADGRESRRVTIADASASSLLAVRTPPPTPLRGDTPLPADLLVREAPGYTLSATMRTSGLGLPARAPELNVAAIEAARKKSELSLSIDLGNARMRVALLGQGFLWPSGTELRARADRYGHVVLWPGESTYRPLGPGGLRAFFDERRVDVGPVNTAELTSKDEVGKRIGVRTRKVELATRAADATIDVGRLTELGEGGVLLCRLVLDLMNASPATPVCTTDELPMRAEVRWKGKGSLVLEVTGVLRRTELPGTSLAVPPPSFVVRPELAATEGIELVVPPSELASFRNGPIDVPPVPGVDPAGLTVENTTLAPRLLYVDGALVAKVGPGARGLVPGFVRGRYLVQWRSVLGDAFEDPAQVTVPGVTRVGPPPDPDEAH